MPFKLHSVGLICFQLNPFKQSGSCVTTRNYIILKTNISFALFSAGNNEMRCGCSVFCLVSTEISNSDKHQDSNSWRGIVIGLKRNGNQKVLSKLYSLSHCKEQHNTAILFLLHGVTTFQRCSKTLGTDVNTNYIELSCHPRWERKVALLKIQFIVRRTQLSTLDAANAIFNIDGSCVVTFLPDAKPARSYVYVSDKLPVTK